MGTDDNKLQAWREEKECEWKDQDSKLRKKHPTRAQCDAWMDKQCAKSRHNASVARAGASDGPKGSGEPVVSLQDVHFTHTRYGVTKVLHGVSLDLLDGQVTGMFGLNEAGKTTIARLLTGELKADSGSRLCHCMRYC